MYVREIGIADRRGKDRLYGNISTKISILKKKKQKKIYIYIYIYMYIYFKQGSPYARVIYIRRTLSISYVDTTCKFETSLDWIAWCSTKTKFNL